VTFSIETMARGTFVPMLRSLGGLLDKAAASGIDPAALVAARLAPDMYTLAQQVQLVCDHATGGVARLVGREPPRVEDGEATLETLKARIARAIAYVESVEPSAFDGAAEREIEMPLMGDLVLRMPGGRFLRDWSFAHFYFHLVTAYDILRHRGVALGKRDFVSQIGDAVHKRAAG
jgi:hypothetical protein